MRPHLLLILCLFITFAWNVRVAGAEDTPNEPARLTALIERYCLDCHSGGEPEGQFSLDGFASSLTRTNQHEWESDRWEKVHRRLLTRQMPPANSDRPSNEQYDQAIDAIDTMLQKHATKFPRPGATASMRRMTRYEYRQAVRDLLRLEVDVDELLPADSESHGFDNVTTGELSPTLLSRYLTAAERISRTAIGRRVDFVEGRTVRLPPDRTQDRHVEGLPLGTRGGTVVDHHFPQDGQYEVHVRLTRDRDEKVEGIHGVHDLDVLLDGKRIDRLTTSRPQNGDYSNVDSELSSRFAVKAGRHRLGVTFPQQYRSLMEIKRQPFDASFNRHRHPRQEPAVFEISIVGPFQPKGAGRTASRDVIFVCYPDSKEEELACGETIIRNLVRKAYRRPPAESDLTVPLSFFRREREGSGFEAGIEAAIAAILVNPNFLFRIETVPPDVKSGENYAVSDIELASRLSFFLWSSIPDEELLTLAEKGTLHDPVILERQVERMLADPRSESLAKNFACQWLHLRNLDSIQPDLRLFPDWDDNLRQAFCKETELLFHDVVTHDRSVSTLIDSPYTFLNERLARHYGIDHVYGSHFRRVDLDQPTHRGGLLRQGSVLTVTSYATRTSPTIRGDWILSNLIGTPPPPPPPNVPALEEKNTATNNLSVRDRLSLHRGNPACATCHDLIDPLGFTLESFDAVGRWRELENGQPVDASGELPDGSFLSGIDALEKFFLERPEIFATTIVEKLMTYALGRGIESYDGPAIRRVVSDAERDNYQFSTLVKGIVLSPPFLMRTAP
ncbi:hypothetical protein Pan97_29050 [Bremerella volcania]|uniref:Planctomycete cytochrome C n=1 Tax=Bremerella volcania TaxID=2527984 RepID=A0A518C9F2_9BACT|nr:DUF1592 domain-containing protein [Bremerella volcania]QDU75863.1 hypothetical protein Pan97_29050 [Bremerella volcania]